MWTTKKIFICKYRCVKLVQNNKYIKFIKNIKYFLNIFKIYINL